MEQSSAAESFLSRDPEGNREEAQATSQAAGIGANNSNETTTSNSVLFWKFISNLPKSITQRARSLTSDSLSTEVAGYLARKMEEHHQQESTTHIMSKCKHSNEIISKPRVLASGSGPSSSCVQISQDGQRLIKIVGPILEQQQQQAPGYEAQAQHTQATTYQPLDQHQHQHQQQQQTSAANIKLSIAPNSNLTPIATATATATASISSASSLSSCVLSEASSVSEVRLKWGKKMDFLLSIIGFAVDLANIWRFPYLVYKNGGGVFLIPYVTMLIFGGIPLFFLELCLGQFVKKGPITVWNKICPAMKGVGYCSILISWYVSFYYNVLIGWSVYFIYRSLISFGEKMPWEDCDNPWNSAGNLSMGNKRFNTNLTAMENNGKQTLDHHHLHDQLLHPAPITSNSTTTLSETFALDNMLIDNNFYINNQQQQHYINNNTCVSISLLKTLCSDRNETLELCKQNVFFNVTVVSPATDFFVKELSQIDQSTGLDDMGHLRLELVCCVLIVYLLHYFSLFRGLETSGKVVWVTATAPYLILSVLLIRGLFLPGAARGMQYYLSPRLEKLADPQVWTDAAVQVFYSIGVGFGVHLTYASFNNHNNNCHRDCLMTSAVNVITSVYSGLVVFVYIGYMAQNLGVEIDEVASEGYSLVFEVYPEALTTLPFARFWSILFFIMLLTLGIDSAMGGLEAVITGIEDEFKFAKSMHRGLLTALVIFSSFLFALISCTQGGAYTLFWFDIYSASVSLLFSALFEALGVVYFYGIDKFILDIESMLGKRPHMFYIICWKYISPLFLVGIIFTSIYTATAPTYRNYTFPTWSIVLGWCLTFSSVSAVPIVAIWHYFKGRHEIRKPGVRSRASGASSGRHGNSRSGKRTPNHQPIEARQAPPSSKSINWVACHADMTHELGTRDTTAV